MAKIVGTYGPYLHDWEKPLDIDSKDVVWDRLRESFAYSLHTLGITSTAPQVHEIHVLVEPPFPGYNGPPGHKFLGGPVFDWWPKASIDKYRNLLAKEGSFGARNFEKAGGRGVQSTAEYLGLCETEQERHEILIAAAYRESSFDYRGGRPVKGPKHTTAVVEEIRRVLPRHPHDLKHLVQDRWHVNSLGDIMEFYAVVIKTSMEDWQLVKVVGVGPHATVEV